MIEANYRRRPIDSKLVRKFVDTIRVNGETHNYFEVSWALFLAKALRLQIAGHDLDAVYNAESAICALLILDLNKRGLIEGAIDPGFWLSFYNEDGLHSSMWLLVYEATLKNWLPRHVPCFVTAHPLFGPMISKGIEFYDERRNVTTTRQELRLKKAHDALAARIFRDADAYF
jgi:hypothetical protein